MPGINSADYKIALKSDGVRYTLFLTCRPGADNSAVALMIDRSWNMFEVEVLAPEAYFVRQTLIEGELVWQQPNEKILLYLIFDCTLLKGVNMMQAPFGDRIAGITKCTRLSEEISAPGMEGIGQRIIETDSIGMIHYDPKIIIRPKCFVSLEHVSRLWSERQDMDHHVDGIILNKVDSCYNTGSAKHGSMYKWKHQHTIDLTKSEKWVSTKNGVLHRVIHGKKVVLSTSKIETGVGDLVEYLICNDENTITLFPLRKRPDKNCANSEFVVHSTIQNVMESITTDDLLQG